MTGVDPKPASVVCGIEAYRRYAITGSIIDLMGIWHQLVNFFSNLGSLDKIANMGPSGGKVDVQIQRESGYKLFSFCPENRKPGVLHIHRAEAGNWNLKYML